MSITSVGSLDKGEEYEDSDVTTFEKEYVDTIREVMQEKGFRSVGEAIQYLDTQKGDKLLHSGRSFVRRKK